MRRTLLLTNDFPPRAGGIQSYVAELAARLPADRLVVYAPAWDGRRGVRRRAAVSVHPAPDVADAAATRVAGTGRPGWSPSTGFTAVWFGAAAPLGLLAPSMRGRERDGRWRVRTVTRSAGRWCRAHAGRCAGSATPTTCVTFVSRYSRRSDSPALGPRRRWNTCRQASTRRFRPDPAARRRSATSTGSVTAPTVVCVSRLVPRKGQDALIRSWPQVLERSPTPGC